MHWSAISTTFLLALISWWLVHFNHMESWEAMLDIGLTALMIILLLLGVSLLLSGNGRAALWGGFKHALRRDWHAFLKLFKGD